MNIDEHLSKFRLVPLPPDLRSRVLAAAPTTSRWRAWLRVAALILFASVVVFVNARLESRLARQLRPAVSGEATARPVVRAFAAAGVAEQFVAPGVKRARRTGPTWANLRLDRLSRRT